MVKSGSAAERITIKWPYFTSMSFVMDYVLPVRGEGNLQEPELSDDRDVSLSDDREVSTVAEITDETREESSSTSMFPASPASSMSISTQLGRKRIKKSSTKQTDMSRFLELEEQRLALLKEDTNREADNPDLQFFKSLLPFMTSLTEIEKLEVRTEIQQLVLTKLKSKQMQLNKNNFTQMNEDATLYYENEQTNSFLSL